MGNSKTNLLTAGFKGKVGNQFVLRRRNGTSIMAARPNTDNLVPTPAQLEVRQKFSAASSYAKKILLVPEYKEAYQAKAGPGQSAYTMAIADYFSSPWIEAVDANFYKGNPGDLIRVLAFDDFRVTKVQLSLKDASGNILEEGSCVKESEGDGWIYTATTAQQQLTGLTINVLVYDLPGHTIQSTVTL
jgi:hypothetical protein